MSGSRAYHARAAAELKQRSLHSDRTGTAMSDRPVSVGMSDLFQRAYATLAAGREGEAERLFVEMAKSQPDDPRAHLWLGRLAGGAGRHVEGIDHLRIALALDPHNAEALAQMADLHASLHDAEQALACVEAAERQGGSDVTLDLIASTYSRLGLHRKSAEALERAAALGSRNAIVHFNLATSLKFCGDFARARAACERAIELAPNYYKAHAALTNLGGITQDNNHIGRLERLIGATRDPIAFVHLCHAAAREHDAIGNYGQALDLLGKAKRVLRDNIRTPGESPERLADALAVPSTPGALRGAGCDSSRPIFVVGMPRTGTTVVDRILSNHPQVRSIGESWAFCSLMRRQFDGRSAQIIDVATIDKARDCADLSGIGAAYIARARHAAGNFPRFVDKLHLNIFLAGFIQRALPQARIVCVVRHPLDTIVSNYKQLFEYSTPNYRYSLDLTLAARFYVQFRRLVTLWRAAFPERFHTVEYESLVADPVREARAMFDFCELSWQPEYVHIENNDAPTATASAVQVREAINRKSIGSWKNYDFALDSVKTILRAGGATF